MTAKEFLTQVYNSHQEITAVTERISRLQSVAYRTTATLKTTTAGKRFTRSRIEEAVVNLHEQIDRLSAELNRLIEVNNEVETAISRVANADERRLLEYRYLCFLSWKQISGLMNKSERQVFRLHEVALKNVKCQ